MGVVMKARELRWRAAGHYTRTLPAVFLDGLAGGRGLEIGGPSPVFRAGGLWPAYAALAHVDGVQFSDRTVWHGEQGAGAYRPDGDEERGQLHIVDGTTLDGLADASYDAVLASHVIEHFANPLRALAAWRRVLRPGGHVGLVAPHLEGTFDHRRPLTSLEHVVADFAAGTGEDDLTHLEEVVALHDLGRDVPYDPAEFRAMMGDNPRRRMLHHHTFTTASLLDLLEHAGLEIVAAQARWPHDVYVLGRWPRDGAAAARFDRARVLRASPFRRDRG